VLEPRDRVSEEPDGERHDGARHTPQAIRGETPARVIELMHGYADEDEAGNNRNCDYDSRVSRLARRLERGFILVACRRPRRLPARGRRRLWPQL
jgi:hypothetical protein